MNQPVNCQPLSLAPKSSKCKMEDFLEYDIFTAASIGDLEFLVSKIRLANVNDFNYGKWTAMMYASYYDHPNVVAFLLNIGGDPNAGNKTSLMLAASCGHENVLKVLLNLGKIKDNVQDSHGYTALHHAVSSGHYESSSILISFGSNLIAETNGELTPLMLAAQYGHERLVELLIKSGSNPSFKTSKGQTAFHLARENGHDRLASILGQLVDPMFTKNPKNVIEILEELKLTKYRNNFHGIEFERFLELTDEDLKDLGISLIGPRRKLTSLIEKYQQ